jgi:hypothetical protein
MEKIEQSDLAPIMALQGNPPAFTRALRRIETDEQLLRAIGRYVQFNAIFGGGVANLAGEVAARQALFRDAAEPNALLSDRSVEVAAEIFSAAVDEFGSRAAARRHTHRTLAQATLKGAGEFFGCDPPTLERIARSNPATLLAVGRVHEGYGLNRALDDAALFRAMGFHIGSERLADEEFRLLDAFLREEHADLVHHLKNSDVAINGATHPAYLWIQIHTTVEAGHFADAVVSANQALRYYAGNDSARQVKQWVLEGVTRFAEVQMDFMEGLITE